MRTALLTVLALAAAACGSAVSPSGDCSDPVMSASYCEAQAAQIGRVGRFEGGRCNVTHQGGGIAEDGLAIAHFRARWPDPDTRGCYRPQVDRAVVQDVFNAP